MKEGAITLTTVAAVSVLAVSSLAWWFRRDPPMPIEIRTGTALEKIVLRTGDVARVNIEGTFKKLDGAPSKTLTGSWPAFRGGASDNISREATSLADSWPDTGPKVLWSVDLGEGYAGPAVANGCVYLLDYQEPERSDVLRCFSFDDGREIWRRAYKVQVIRDHGMSRTVPAVTDRFCVTIGPRCHVLCVDAMTGAFKWGMDMVRDWGSKEPMWYTGQCPLIDNGVVVLAPAGPAALLMGVDLASGQVVWQTPNPRGWQMSHACVQPMTFKGRKMYAYPAIGGIVGVAADGPDRGKILWETTEWNHSVMAPSVVATPEGRVVVTAGRGEGSAIFQLSEDNGTYGVKLVNRLNRTTFACEQHTPILYKDHLFTVLPADAGPNKRQAVCMTPDAKVVWTSGSTEQFGLGPFMIADDKLFILGDEGELTMLRATPDRYEKLAAAKIMDGREAWAPLAIVNGRLLMRDYRKMLCLDVARK